MGFKLKVAELTELELKSGECGHIASPGNSRKGTRGLNGRADRRNAKQRGALKLRGRHRGFSHKKA